MIEVEANPSQSNELVLSIKELCADVLGKAEEYKKAFEFRTEPVNGSVEFWQNYRKRLMSYDRNFNYPGSVNPVKCAIKGWSYLGDGKIQCVECKKEIQLNVKEQENIDQSALTILKSLRNAHDSLCSFHAAFHYPLILHSVNELKASIKANVPEQLYKSEEISNEFANLAHVANVEQTFDLFFAIAGWFVKKDKTFFCKLCLQNVNPEDHKTEVMDPLKLHYDYCPILETYPQWKLALEEYVYAHSNPKSISENFALIQRQLALTGLPTKTHTYGFSREFEQDDEMPSVYDEGETAAPVEANRTYESMHDPRNQSIDVIEQPQQLRDTDYEAEIQQESLNRKRLREETEEQESPAAKRTYLPFPHNYLAEYNQPTENVVLIAVSSTDPNLNENYQNAENAPVQAENDNFIRSPGFQQDSNSSILSPQMEEDVDADEEEENELADGHEILNEQELDRPPVNDSGERGYDDSDDAQSAEAESYNDDDASTNSEPANENAPYDEPEEFEDYSRSQDEETREEPQNANKTINLDEEEEENQSDVGQSFEQYDGEAEDSYYEGDGDDYNEEEMEEEPEYDDEADPAGDGDDDSDSDIICLD